LIVSCFDSVAICTTNITFRNFRSQNGPTYSHHVADVVVLLCSKSMVELQTRCSILATIDAMMRPEILDKELPVGHTASSILLPLLLPVTRLEVSRSCLVGAKTRFAPRVLETSSLIPEAEGI
jgi:hypothetical protein